MIPYKTNFNAKKGLKNHDLVLPFYSTDEKIKAQRGWAEPSGDFPQSLGFYMSPGKRPPRTLSSLGVSCPGRAVGKKAEY